MWQKVLRQVGTVENCAEGIEEHGGGGGGKAASPPLEKQGWSLLGDMSICAAPYLHSR